MKTSLAYLTGFCLLVLLPKVASAQAAIVYPPNITIKTDTVQDYFIRFPDDVIATNCVQGNLYGEPVFFGATCPQTVVSYEDIIFGISDVCYTITREWKIVNGCADSSAVPFVYVPNPAPNPVAMDPSNMPGPILSACDAPAPWNPTIVKKHWSDTVVTNYCSFWEIHPKVYLYNQIIRIIDWAPPLITDCPAAPGNYIDSSQNELALWNDVYDPNLPAQNLSETEVDLSINASDDCTGGSVGIDFQLFLDLDNNGTQESVVTSNNLPVPGTIRYNNINSAPSYMGGTVVSFDTRPVPANQKWQFSCPQNNITGDRTAFVRWNTTLSPNTNVLPKLPQGTHRILWTVTDGCGNITTCEYTFTIQPGPANNFPMINCPANVTVETTASTCDAAYQYIVAFSDGALSQTAGLPSGNFPLGLTLNEFVVTDTAGNSVSCSFTVRVVDRIAPVARCVQHAVVYVGADDPADCYGSSGNASFGGVAWINASAFNDGSSDACSGIKLTVRRAPPYSACILGLNTINGQPDCDDTIPDFPTEFERALSEADSIKFYCCEAGSTQKIRLRAYQLDANGNISTNANGVPIFSECEVQVELRDNITPTCTPPPNVTISCEDFHPNLSFYGQPVYTDNCCVSTNSETADWQQFDSVCLHGTITRRFQAFDCSLNSSDCSQQITVNYDQDYYIRFPDDVFQTYCSGQPFGEPVFFGNDCELLQATYIDEMITPVPNACIIIERNWYVINGCNYNPALPLINIPNPNPSPITGHSSNLPGVIVSSCNALAPWNPSIVKINPTDTAATNFCTFWNANSNGYRYKQHIRVIDSAYPQVSDCPVGPAMFADTTPNDPALWNGVYNPNLPANDLTEREIDLSITATDECYGSDVSIQYQLFLDIDGDGLLETVVNSLSTGVASLGWNNIMFGNIPNGSGVPRQFDGRPVNPDQKWGFAIRNTISGANKTSSVRFNTPADQNTFVVPELPHGTHKIKWFVSDGCGNESICEHVFTIQEGPTSGLESFENQGFVLYQNEPNPFRSSTGIGFRLPYDAEAELSVYDTDGRRVFSKKGNFAEGYNVVSVEGGWLATPGVLYYKLESGANIAWRKMILTH